ncbi:hypothetical protein AS25_03145 [Kocuria marina]|uniref:Uncharacterized protein n=1 Tax=Kocuria marina TaxID=223184 RepID=A0A0B0DA15_9MICC|nr:hypothetical protein [Kocuria marina]KHE74831.1 hypothetical protein AS25_03145 [Kocuria marina]
MSTNQDENTAVQDEQHDEDTPVERPDTPQDTAPGQPEHDAQQDEPHGDEQDNKATPLEKQLAKARKEAAERRVELREATEHVRALTTELDETRAELDHLRTGRLRDVLAQQRVTYDAFTAAGYDLPGILDENGQVDTKKLREAVDDTAARYGEDLSSPDVVARRGMAHALEALRAERGRREMLNGRGGNTWGDVLKKQ